MTSHSNNRKVRLAVESLEDRAVPAAAMPDTSPLEAYGSVAGSIGVVQVVHTDDPTNVIYSFIPYGTAFTGGVRVAVGGVNTSDPNKSQYLVTAPGPGGGPEIRVYNLATGLAMFDFMALNPNFRGGANVAVGDVNGDGYDDIIVGAGAGGGPQVQVFNGNPSNAQGQTPEMLSNFYAYPSTFTGGVSVAAGDVTGNNTVDVVTGAGPGGGPLIKEFDGTTGLLIPPPFTPFFALNPAFRGGTSVATMPDVNIPGLYDVIVGAGPGGGPQVQVFASGTLIRSFFAGNNPDLTSGINVASFIILSTETNYYNLQPGQIIDSQIVVGTDGTISNVDVFNGDTLQATNLPMPVLTVLPGLTPGVFVGADNSTPSSPPPPATD